MLLGSALVSAFVGWPVADRFDVVAVGVVDECTVVVRVVDRARPRRAVVLSAGGQGGGMERVHQGPALGGECHMDALGRRPGRDEEPRPAAIAEPDIAWQIENDLHAERSEGLFVEGTTCGDIVDAEHHMIDH